MANDMLLRTVAELTRLVEKHPQANEPLLQSSGSLIQALVAHDNWLPDAFARAQSGHYSQYLLYGDPLERFSLVSFVWGPGQKTPVHDHTVWGIVGILRGTEIEQQYRNTGSGLVPHGPAQSLDQGEIAYIRPDINDIHCIENASDGEVTVSIHLYGGNIGRITRSVYDLHTGERKPFVSGYSNTELPNLW